MCSSDLISYYLGRTTLAFLGRADCLDQVLQVVADRPHVAGDNRAYQRYGSIVMAPDGTGSYARFINDLSSLFYEIGARKAFELALWSTLDFKHGVIIVCATTARLRTGLRPGPLPPGR